LTSDWDAGDRNRFWTLQKELAPQAEYRARWTHQL